MKLGLSDIAASALLLSATIADAKSFVNWKSFVDQHGSSVDVPVSLVKRLPDDLGLKFQSPDGRASIEIQTTTEARPGFPGHDPEGDMGLQRPDCDVWPPHDLTIKDAVAAYSCTKRDRVHYYLSKYSRSGSVTLNLEYPVEEKALWGRIVPRMASSLRQVPRVEVR